SSSSPAGAATPCPFPAKQLPKLDGPPSARSARPDRTTRLFRTTLSRAGHQLRSYIGVIRTPCCSWSATTLRSTTFPTPPAISTPLPKAAEDGAAAGALRLLFPTIRLAAMTVWRWGGSSTRPERLLRQTELTT